MAQRPEDLDELARKYLEAKAKEQEAKEAVVLAQQAILDRIGDAASLSGNGWKLVRKFSPAVEVKGFTRKAHTTFQLTPTEPMALRLRKLERSALRYA